MTSVQEELLSSFPQLETLIDVTQIIGQGTFSTVYEAHLKGQHVTDVPLAVKHITPVVDPAVLENELRCLTQLSGKHNVVKLLAACRHQDNLALIMPYLKHDKFIKLVKRFSIGEIRDYMRSLLEAVAHLHDNNIIHRDIKPNNFLYCKLTKQCALVDFGLAQFMPSSNPSKRTSPLHERVENGAAVKGSTRQSRSPTNAKCRCFSQPKICQTCAALPTITAMRCGTAGYRPPEVLMKCVYQTTAVDIWACGVILLSLLSGRCNFFHCPDDLSNLAQLVSLFGHKAMQDAATKMDKTVTMSLPERDPLSLKEVCETLRKNSRVHPKRRKLLAPDSAYDLLEKLLMLDPNERITAEDALLHTFLVDTSPTTEV